MSKVPPGSIKIGPIDWEVESTHLAIQAVRAIDGDSAVIGNCDYMVQKITVDPAVSVAQRRCSLFHEVLHALLNTYRMPYWSDENLVGPLAPALLDTLQRNPELVQYLLDTG